MERLKIIAQLMPNAKRCYGNQLIARKFMDGPTALRIAVRVDDVPDWFALVGMLAAFGSHVRRY